MYHFTNRKDGFLADTDIIKIAGKYGGYGVHVFFIISGLVIPFAMHQGNYHLKDFKRFMAKRIIRIEPPYIVSIVIVLVFGYLSTLSPYYRGQPFHIDILGLLCHIGYLNAFLHLEWINPVYWTLAIEFQYYILIALLYPLLASKKVYIWASAVLVFNLVSFLIPDQNFIFYYSLYFTIGIIIYKFFVNEINRVSYYSLISGILIAVFLKFEAAGLIAAMLPVVFIFTRWENKFCRFMGNISYSLYLLHVPVGLRVINLSENFVKNEWARYLIILLALIITIGASYIFYLWVELPFKNISKKIRYDDKKPAYVVNSI